MSFSRGSDVFLINAGSDMHEKRSENELTQAQTVENLRLNKDEIPLTKQMLPKFMRRGLK